jgi:hypothetical protein
MVRCGFGFEVPLGECGKNGRNFKSATLQRFPLIVVHWVKRLDEEAL